MDATRVVLLSKMTGVTPFLAFVLALIIPRRVNNLVCRLALDGQVMAERLP